MKLHQIAKEVDEVAAANGFDRPTVENLPVKVVMTITELHEAREACMGEEGADPLAEELADVAIRTMSILSGVWGEAWADRTKDFTTTHDNVWMSPEKALWRILRPLCQAVECWRKDHLLDTRIALEFALKETFWLASVLGYDIIGDITTKNERNRHRGQLHGKVRSAG